GRIRNQAKSRDRTAKRPGSFEKIRAFLAYHDHARVRRCGFISALSPGLLDCGSRVQKASSVLIVIPWLAEIARACAEPCLKLSGIHWAILAPNERGYASCRRCRHART